MHEKETENKKKKIWRSKEGDTMQRWKAADYVIILMFTRNKN